MKINKMMVVLIIIVIFTFSLSAVPADVLDLNNWKLILPNSEEIYQPELASFSDDYAFFVNSDGDGIVFRANCKDSATKNSPYLRSELREMKMSDNTDEASWGTNDGTTHTMIIEQAITHSPVEKHHVLAGQVNRPNDDVIAFRLEDEKLFIDINGDKGPTLDDDYNAGQIFTAKFVAENGQIKCYYNGSLVDIYDINIEGCYFTAGCYTQSNTDEGDDPDAYGEVQIYDLDLMHNGSDEGNDPDYPSDVIPFFNKWKITLGDGEEVKDLIGYEHEDYFYDTTDNGVDWVVYKTPNSGSTTPNSSNTRSELRQESEWTPETGGKLTGTLKVMQVSTTGDARVPAAFSVVIGQIHSSEGHENEPLKIFYKKYPGHTKGSVFWNYEINTDGDNSERWDYSTAVWGYDLSVVGESPNEYPNEPENGIELGEEFSYEVNVYNGTMHLTFNSYGHETKTFTKSLVGSEYTNSSDIPEQVLTVFKSTGQDGTEQTNAYAGELQYFKQGAYNQANGKNPENNMVWNTGAETYGGDLSEQYENGSYAEIWFKKATVGPSDESSSNNTSSSVDIPNSSDGSPYSD